VPHEGEVLAGTEFRNNPVAAIAAMIEKLRNFWFAMILPSISWETPVSFKCAKFVANF
jgi:hypothetical protein